MEEKLDKISDTLTDIKVDLAKIRKDVNYHIHRTNLLEAVVKKSVDDMKPVQAHVQAVKLLIHVGTWSIGIIAAVASAYAVLK